MRHKSVLAASLLTACATAGSPGIAEEPTDFTVRGQIADPTVTHVVAITEQNHQLSRIVTHVAGGGFQVALGLRQPYLMVFVDDEQIGRAKTVGVLRSGQLDTLLAATDGEVDLGNIHFAAGSAFPELDEASVQAALGLDDGQAAALGAADDFATRYANVDVDSDGVLDAYQPDFKARLDIHAAMRLGSGARSAPTLEDLMNGTLTMTYDGAAITARMPDSFGEFTIDTARVTFDAPFYGLASGVDSPVVPAGTAVSGSDLIMGTDHNFGVYARANHLLPAGDYRFEVPGGVVEFTDVRPDTDPVLAPFVSLRMPVGCSSACVPDGIAFTWKHHTDSGWIALTDAETSVLQPESTVQVVQTGAMGVSYRKFEIPRGHAAGTLAWDSTTVYAGVAAQPAGDVRFMAVRFGMPLGISGDASFAVTPRQISSAPAR